MHRNKAKAGKKEMARSLRNNATASERLLWEHIRRNALGVKFRRQAVMFGWIADFWCPERKLVVELDGSFHQGRAAKDAARDRAMLRSGVRTLRIPSRMVFEDIDEVVRRIRHALTLPVLKGDGYFDSKWRPAPPKNKEN